MQLEEAKKILSESIIQEKYHIFNKDLKSAVAAVLQSLENSVPKEVIEEKIKELKGMKVEGEVFKTSVNFAIKILQELSN